MSSFPVNRTHPPRRLVYEDEQRVVEIRPWSFDDIDALIAAAEASRPELGAFMPWALAPMTREDRFDVVRRFAADYWAGREYVMGVFSGEGEVLGGVGLHPRTALNPKALEVGYWCHTRHAGRGVATLAVRILVALVFDHFASDRMQVMHDKANVASRRVVEKCGFHYEGDMRNATAAVDDELVRKGYAATGCTRIYSLCPEDLPRLAWLPEVRARLRVVDALGGARSC